MSDETFTIVFSLRETLASLGLKIRTFEPENFDFAVSKEEIMQALKDNDLLIDRNPEEDTHTHGDWSIYDYNEDAYFEVQTAISDAWHMGTEKRYNNAVESLIESCLSIFANYGDVEYACEGEHGTSHIVKKGVKGIDKYNVDMGEQKVHITFHRDMVHVLNSMIECYGMFGVSCEDAEYMANESSMNEVEAEVKSHFHHLDTYWECYGDHKPELNYEADFDRRYFDQEMQEIANRYKTPNADAI